MHLLPKLQQFFEMSRGNVQDFPHIAALRMTRPDCIHAVGQRNCPVLPQVYDYFDLADKTMNVARFVVLRIGDKSCAAKAMR
jgi:hypothetical protein